jgi:hypothetical protein
VLHLGQILPRQPTRDLAPIFFPWRASPWADCADLGKRGTHLSVAQRCAPTARTHRQPHSVLLGCAFGPMTRGPGATVVLPTTAYGAGGVPAPAEILARVS